MTADGGGYTFYKAKVSRQKTAAQAEVFCEGLGMQLFVPRSQAHLAAAWGLANTKSLNGDKNKDYLSLMGIYPAFVGAKCDRTAFQSGNDDCDWQAGDGGTFWVSSRTDLDEPDGFSGEDDNGNGNNGHGNARPTSLTGTLQFDFGNDGNLSSIREKGESGFTAKRFMCDVGDKDPSRTSCQAWYAAGFRGRGQVWIDPDGIGAGAPMLVTCDQASAGGGWRLVASETFDSATTGWSAGNTLTTCGSYGAILGGFGVLANATTTKTYQWATVAHTQARLELDYIKIDSWDGEIASVLFAGSSVWSKAFCSCNQSCASSGGLCGGAAVCGMSSSAEERREHVSATVTHSTSTVAVSGKSTVDQSSNDESWGLDNIYIWVR